MIALVQRVSSACVTSRQNPSKQNHIDKGLCILLGIHESDTNIDAQKISRKLSRLRLFPDDTGKLNLDASQIGGSLLIISQFTLISDPKVGSRPSFTHAAKPAIAKEIYNTVISLLEKNKIPVQSGFFGEHMDISLNLDGPVTIILDSTKL